MDRYWLLTNTCYGTWLPGDQRGFVGRVREHRAADAAKPRVTHNAPKAPYDIAMPGLADVAHSRLKSPPIHLTQEHADILLAQFQETARIRRWDLRAVAIMYNHFHIVVGVMGDPKPSKILGDFKSWATRQLSERFGSPPSGTWWTEQGSKRKLSREEAIAAAIHYVLCRQPNPLVIWSEVQVSTLRQA